VQKGSLALAHSRAESGLLLAREIGLGETVGTGYLALGLIAMQQADLDGATRFFQQAEATYLELAAPRMVAWAAWHSAQVLGLRGDLAAARRKHEEALAVRLTHELIGFAAESRAALAALALDEERFAEAETLARAAIGHFAAERQHDNEAWAQSVLAQALVAQRKLAEAQPVLLRAQELAAASQNLLIRLPVQRRALGLRQATGVHAVETERELARLLAEATASGMVLEQFELRLEHYRLALAQAPGKVVVPEALALAQEAKRHGLGLIEKKLAALLGPQPGSAERDRP
jgi:tetratricopeptide (TPR) repeat protein